MATITIDVPGELGDALAPLGQLRADEIALTAVLRDALWAVGAEVVRIAEDADDMSSDDLRPLAGRLELIAAALEAA